MMYFNDSGSENGGEKKNDDVDLKNIEKLGRCDDGEDIKPSSEHAGLSVNAMMINIEIVFLFKYVQSCVAYDNERDIWFEKI